MANSNNSNHEEGEEDDTPGQEHQEIDDKLLGPDKPTVIAKKPGLEFNPFRKSKKIFLNALAKRRFERGESSSLKQPAAISERAENYFEINTRSFHYGVLDIPKNNTWFTSAANDPLTRLFHAIHQERDSGLVTFYTVLNSQIYQPFEQAIERDEMHEVYTVDLKSLKAWTQRFNIECEYLFHDKDNLFSNVNGHRALKDLARRIDQESETSKTISPLQAVPSSAQEETVTQEISPSSQTVSTILSIFKRQNLNLPDQAPPDMEVRC